MPWIYWAWLVDLFRREICIVEGGPYGRVVRRDWLAAMLTFLIVAGGGLSPAVAYIPLQVILPLALAVGVMFSLASYLAKNCAPEKWLRPLRYAMAEMYRKVR